MTFIVKRVIVSIVLVSVILAGCGKTEVQSSNKYLDSIVVSLSDQSTTKNFEHNYEVNLTNNKNAKVNVDSVEIILKMKSMNHKVDVKLNKISKGIYRGKITLPMNGSWDKIVVLKQGKFIRKVNGASIR
ncbi:FixH family protein [Gottfriedia luciferensis]|uniref:FixH family protein n=1 Tax=Gottfriedia luciferensis TaxID=178774 RepID=UPI000B4350E3|nr:FixH family protein [Gottfriedia luciferensis]